MPVKYIFYDRSMYFSGTYKTGFLNSLSIKLEEGVQPLSLELETYLKPTK